MRQWISAVLLLLLLLLPTAAQAEWLEASSAHFVVYADDSERDIRRFSEQLERYHEAMEIVTGSQDMEAPSPSNRVTVFVVRNAREVQRLMGTDNRNVHGFYIPRAGGSVAFVPRIQVNSREPDLSMIMLLHEYAHHFLISNSRFPSPRWMSEGAAEFFASAEFTTDGGISVGRPAQHRGWELALGRNVTALELVDAEAYEKKSRADDMFYGKSWLLYHYLVFTPERQGQLQAYMQGLASGKSSREAAEQVFGDLDLLERELKRYLDQRTMLSLVFKPEQLGISPVTVRRLSQGEAAMMPVRIRSRRGVNEEQAKALLIDAREVAARFQEDPAVLAALAEAEYDAGNSEEAIVAADAALALDPSQLNAYVQKGYALFREASDADDPAAAFRAARQPFIALNKLENDHPLPLIYFYMSFALAGATPPEVAIQGLERAAELAPFDLGLRVTVARQQALDGKLASARANLVPAAYNPHGGPQAERARQLLDRLTDGLAPAEASALFDALDQAETEAPEES